MMEKLKYTKFKTLLISSFICISIIPVVLLGFIYLPFVKTGTDQAVRKTNVAKC